MSMKWLKLPKTRHLFTKNERINREVIWFLDRYLESLYNGYMKQVNAENFIIIVEM